MGVQGGVQFLPGALGVGGPGGEEHPEQLRADAAALLGARQDFRGVREVGSGGGVQRQRRTQEDEKVRRLRGERGAEHIQRGGTPGIEHLQGAAAFPAKGLPRAVAEIFLAGPRHLRAKKPEEQFRFSCARRPEQHEPRRTLEQEERFDRRDLPQNRLLERVRQPLDELLQFVVEREKSGWFHAAKRDAGEYVRAPGLQAEGVRG